MRRSVRGGSVGGSEGRSGSRRGRVRREAVPASEGGAPNRDSKGDTLVLLTRRQLLVQLLRKYAARDLTRGGGGSDGCHQRVRVLVAVAAHADELILEEGPQRPRRRARLHTAAAPAAGASSAAAPTAPPTAAAAPLHAEGACRKGHSWAQRLCRCHKLREPKDDPATRADRPGAVQRHEQRRRRRDLAPTIQELWIVGSTSRLAGCNLHVAGGPGGGLAGCNRHVDGGLAGCNRHVDGGLATGVVVVVTDSRGPTNADGWGDVRAAASCTSGM